MNAEHEDSRDELDAVLSTAAQELLDHLRSTADPTITLVKLMASDIIAAPPRNPSSQSPSRPISEPGAATTIITLRARAHALNRDMDRALDRHMDRVRDRALNDGRDRSLNLWRDLARARDHVRDDRDAGLDLNLARALSRALTRTLALVLAINRNDVTRAVDHVRVLSRNLVLAHSLAVDLDFKLDIDFDPERAVNHDVACELTRTLSHALARALDVIEVDISGVGLYQLSLPHLDVLNGVIWTEDTIWPPAIADKIRARSNEIRSGVFQVHADTEQGSLSDLGHSCTQP